MKAFRGYNNSVQIGDQSLHVERVPQKRFKDVVLPSE